MFSKSNNSLNQLFQTHRIVLLFLTFIALLNVAGCSQEAAKVLSANCDLTEDETTLCLEILDANGAQIRNLDQNTTASVVATLLTIDSTPVVGAVIAFTTDLGTLASVSGLTDVNGKATVDIASGGSPNAGNVTATATINGVELNVDYGFAVGGTIDPGTGGGGGTTPVVSQSSNGAMSFLSANPQQITLKSTGGFGLSELSVVSFKLVGIDGFPIANQTINFTINNEIGGIIIDPVSAVSGYDGVVSTVVRAGTVPTSVRITAITTLVDNGTNNVIFAQSDMLAIGIGTPDQDSMSISVSNYAPEAWTYDGEEVDVIVRLADQFNNTIPDGTTVYFTTEGGAIQPSCETIDGGCSVKWISQDPKPFDHRVTILATTLGSESFTDTDSDGIYSLIDGEPFTDVNFNGVFDEQFTDTNGNGTFDEAFVSSGNGVWDVVEPLNDSLNGVYDFGEAFTDIGDGKYTDGEPFTDGNANAIWDANEPFTDIGNGKRDQNEPFIDAGNGRWDIGETFTDLPSPYDIGTLFVDRNGNGVFDGDPNDPVGEQNFVDSRNGNGLFDGSGKLPAGEYLIAKDINNNGEFDGPGFADLGEPFLDKNENNFRDVDEYYVDTNRDAVYTSDGDGQYNGILCDANSNICAAEKTVRIRASIVLIMASSVLEFVAKNPANNLIYFSSVPGIKASTSPNFVDARGGSTTVRIFYSDSGGQIPPEGTSVEVTSTTGEILGANDVLLSRIVGLPRSNTATGDDRYNALNYVDFSITDDDLEAEEWGTISIRFTTPRGVITPLLLSVRT